MRKNLTTTTKKLQKNATHKMFFALSFEGGNFFFVAVAIGSENEKRLGRLMRSFWVR